MKQLILALLILASCSTSKRNITGTELLISSSQTECGSYAIKNNGELIGYVVKPFYVEVQNKDDLIIQFEGLIKTDYSSYYNRFYRTYWFLTDAAGDTILDVVMLSEKQVSTIVNWKCEEQDVDTYKKDRGSSFDAAHPQFISYNCSRARFKSLEDPN